MVIGYLIPIIHSLFMIQINTSENNKDIKKEIIFLFNFVYLPYISNIIFYIVF
jgi:hypothetical protein